MRILAIDYGEKRLGLAISDPLGITAQPFDVVEKDGKEISKISDIAKTRNVEKIIIGLPVNMSGSYGESAKKVMEFADTLKKAVEVGIELVDERLSTKEATRRMIESDMSRKKRKQHVDKLAATIILETYLSSRTNI